MCGLVGAFNPSGLTLQEERIFGALLHVDVLRGMDSTGIYAMSDTTSLLIKDVCLPTELAEKNIQDVSISHYPYCVPEFEKEKATLLMGHNRAATVGKVTQHTAHPFEYENVVGTHNGTVYMTRNGDFMESLGVSSGDEDEWLTDSQIIYKIIDKKGPSVIPDLFQKIEDESGAAALVFWDKSNEYLGIVKNEKRSLYTLKRNGTLFWSSDKTILSLVLGYCKAPVNQVTSIVPVEDHTFYKFFDDRLRRVEKTPFTVEKKVKYNSIPGVYTIGRQGYRYVQNKNKKESQKNFLQSLLEGQGAKKQKKTIRSWVNLHQKAGMSPSLAEQTVVMKLMLLRSMGKISLSPQTMRFIQVNYGRPNLRSASTAEKTYTHSKSLLN